MNMIKHVGRFVEAGLERTH